MKKKNNLELNKSKIIKQLKTLKRKGGRELRVFQIAKILNVSHMEIIELVESMNISIESHMSPIDWETLDLIIGQLKNPSDNNHLKKLNEKLIELTVNIERDEKRKKKG